MHAFFGVVAFVLNTIGYVPYIRDILRGKVKPHRITWGVWTILTNIAFVNQIANGGGYSVLFFGSTAILVTITFLLSLKYGMGGASRLDKILLTLALILLAYWVTIRDTRSSTVLAVVIDTIGAIPTIIKTRKHPDTESYPAWVLAGIGGLFSMLAVPNVDFILILYPAYIFLMNGVIVATKYYTEHSQPKKFKNVTK